MRRSMPLCLVALLVASAVLGRAGPQEAQGRPIQILIPPADPSTTELAKLEPLERFGRCVSLHLLERFPEVSEVVAVDEAWARDLLFELRCQRGPSGSKDVLAELADWLPLDAAVTYQVEGRSFICRLHTAKGVRQQESPMAGPNPAASVVYAVAGFLADELKLSDVGRRALVEKRFPDAALENLYLTRRLGTIWIINSGETRLNALRPVATELAQHPRLAAGVIEAGEQLIADTRKPESPRFCLDMVRGAVPHVLGTRYEDYAHRFLRINKLFPKDLENDLWAIVEPLTKGGLDDLLDTGRGEPRRRSVADELSPIARGGQGLARQAGAVRSLGVMRSERLATVLPRLARHPDAPIRQAAGSALSRYEDAKSLALLKTLAADKDASVAFTATYELWRAGKDAGAVLPLARVVSRSGAEQGRDADGDRPAGGLGATVHRAAEVIAACGTGEDADRLSRWASEGDAALRATGVAGLARLGRLPEPELLGVLRSGAGAVVAAGLRHLPEAPGDAVRRQVFLLASHRHPPVAEEARRSLARSRPSDPQQQARFDLATEHLYVRLQLLDKLSRSKEPWAMELLREATSNPDPQVRAEAIARLGGVGPAAARQVLPRLLSDAYRWVRVHAAAVAARVAAPELAATCRARLEAETDPVARRYLEDALAVAENRPLPKAPPPVETFDPKRTTFGMCGYGEKIGSTPAGYYYLLDTKATAEAKAALADRIVLARANSTARNPVQVLFHPVWRDLWWLGLEEDLADTSWLDGVVLGEESMYAGPWQLWDAGWRVFCREAGIDPEKVAGRREQLSECEQRAYLDWEEKRATDGFNRMYDFIKLYYGKLRPGFLVGTFMPDQNGPNAADPRWKFDVGGAYYYAAGNRERYNRIRRFKTLWPERPIIWLVWGGVGTPLDQAIKYNSSVPTDPVAPRGNRAYSHSIAAWLAGAEPGWFAIWLFTDRNAKGPNYSGVWLSLEDIYPNSATLKKAIEHAFGGVEGWYRLQSQTQGMPKQSLDAASKPASEMAEELLKDDSRAGGSKAGDPIALRVKAEKQRVETGYLLEHKHLCDVARTIDGLPHLESRPDVLFVAPFNSPLTDIVPARDFLTRINQVPDLELSRYRLIGLIGCHTAPLEDRTIAAVTRWLREVPGVLYVRGGVNSDPLLEAGTAEDHDGRLSLAWPWARDVEAQKGSYVVKGQFASRLEGTGAKPTVVLWKNPEMKGAVVLDASVQDPLALRRRLEEIGVHHGVGPKFGGKAGIVSGQSQKVLAAATTNKNAEPLALTGMDLLTGEGGAKVGPRLYGAAASEDYQGRYAACIHGVRVLCERPIGSLTPIPGGVRLACDGLVQASAGGGEVTVRAIGGALGAVEGPEAILRWLVAGEEPGMATIATGDARGTVTYVRYRGDVEIVRK